MDIALIACIVLVVLVVCIFLMLCIILGIKKNKQNLLQEIQSYKTSAYYQLTGCSYMLLKKDVGKYGEYLIYQYLSSYEAQGAKFLFNCYLPRANGKMTEIDVLMIYKSGIYVFESKNYSGWIYGDEYDDTWFQKMPESREFIENPFHNPIMQNNLHIKWLGRLLYDESIPIYSIIVFSERCMLKEVNVYSSDIKVIKRDKLYTTVSEIDSENVPVLTLNKIQQIYKKLYPYCQPSMDVIQGHISNIQSKTN